MKREDGQKPREKRGNKEDGRGEDGKRLLKKNGLGGLLGEAKEGRRSEGRKMILSFSHTHAHTGASCIHTHGHITPQHRVAIHM